MLACGQRALAHVSYLESTRAKAQLNRDQTDQFYTGNLASFAPGLTLGNWLGCDNRGRVSAQITPADKSQAQLGATVCMDSNHEDSEGHL